MGQASELSGSKVYWAQSLCSGQQWDPPSGGDLLALGEHLCSTERSPQLNQVLEEIKRAIAEKQTLREPPRSGTRQGRSDSRQSSGLSCCEEA
ncbi:hypothetical protein JOQ06_012937, partial [Pogonophryne albipinna]